MSGTPKQSREQRVFVALSGGVDSAVAAHLLKAQGYAVTGIFIRVWQPDFLPCSQDDEQRAAMRVAAALSIPFKIADLSAEYKRDIVDSMIRDYAAGRTPNPDVWCNRFIKFGAFWEWASREGAHFIATGHHARVRDVDGVRTLLRGVDRAKDQAYFLWTLTQSDLSHVRFPVGEMTKPEVRDYAREHRIPSAERPDSQGLCFVGDVDMEAFLAHYIEPREGVVLSEDGAHIGTHKGAAFYTLGQRAGFTVADARAARTSHYVVATDAAANTITVAATPHATEHAKRTIDLAQCNWIAEVPRSEAPYTAEFRYHGTPRRVRVAVDADDTSIITRDDAQGVLVAPGQSVVVYDEETCLGGGIVV